MTTVTASGGCGGVPGERTARAQAAPTTRSGTSRIGQLQDAWTDAGLRADRRKELRSNTINAMYGSIRHHELYLNDRMVIILEFDLKGADRTAKGFLDFVDARGSDRRTHEPAWRSQEFVLLNTASPIENGAVVRKFVVADHPEREKVLKVFGAFK
jgi:hypothetical protein